jgi:acetyl esterase/lipase
MKSGGRLTMRAIVLFVLAWAPLVGQDKSTYYTVMHPDEFTINWSGFYDQMDQGTAEMREQLRHHLDLPFGEHPKQRLDVYLPPGNVRNAPVFVFFHGGGFREGDRSHYGAVARGFSQNGFITVIAGYRLIAQGYHYPDQAQDAQRALAWTYRNIARYGGNPNRISVGGHSAGAHLTAEISVKTDWLGIFGLPADLIKAAIPISGRYGRRPADDGYVEEEILRPNASPIEHIANTRPRFLVAVGAPEEAYVVSSREFVGALEQGGAKAELLVLEGETHEQTALSLVDPDSVLLKAVLRTIAGGRNR